MIRILTLIALLLPSTLQAREQIRIVGSSTIYPFISSVAEKFGKTTKYKTPIVEATGTGSGFKLFCSPKGYKYPDITAASRKIADSEKALCNKNGITDYDELIIGYDGIIIVNSAKTQQFKLTKQELFLALAYQVPVNGKLQLNPYNKWSDINPHLPNKIIEVYGPPSTSGTRFAFEELVMVSTCNSFKEFTKQYIDPIQHNEICQMMRDDGKFIEAAENENLIIQKLAANNNALAIIGYTFLNDNKAIIQSASIDNNNPTKENIASGKYSLARPLYIYIKKSHFDIIPGLKEFASMLTSKQIIGSNGFLVKKGLIPINMTPAKY